MEITLGLGQPAGACLQFDEANTAVFDRIPPKDDQIRHPCPYSHALEVGTFAGAAGAAIGWVEEGQVAPVLHHQEEVHHLDLEVAFGVLALPGHQKSGAPALARQDHRLLETSAPWEREAPVAETLARLLWVVNASGSAPITQTFKG
jgi:hypothetical protein